MKYYWLVFLVLVVFSSCSRKTEEQLYTEAQAAEGAKNFPVALERYQEILSRFATGTHAEESQYRIALIYNNELHDVAKAVSAYQTFYTQFPASKDAPAALFLTGFLYNNELHNIDSAKVAYELFLQKYPTHELAHSAKFEIETLGKDPMSVIPQDSLAKTPDPPKTAMKTGKKTAK